MRRVLLILVLTVFVLSAGALCRTWYVSPDGTGDVPDIQTGISMASKGDTLLLADGIFTGDGNRGLSYQGKAIVIRSQSGDPHLCVIDCQGSEVNIVRGFSFDRREGPRSKLEGVTVRNGYMNEGGGIWCWSTSPSISNVILSGNVAVYFGGGIYCGRGSVPVLTNVTFYENSADQGGGVYCTYYAAPVVQNSIISYSRQGGAVVLGGPGNTPTFNCCDIYGNVGGDWDGGVIGQYGQTGNISEDPMFCMDENSEKPLSLHSNSPCICIDESGCGIMGAAGIGCFSGIEATVDIDPDVLNLRSRRRWLTCYLELPEGHDPLEIDISKVVFNGVVSAELRPTAVGDRDSNGIADRMVKFSWPEALASLEGSGEFEIEVSGEVGGLIFSGTDMVTVLLKDMKMKQVAEGIEGDPVPHLNCTSPSLESNGVMIQFDIPEQTHVRLAIHDVQGRLVQVLVDEVKPSSSYSIHWDANDVSQSSIAPGIYFVTFQIGEHRETGKVTVIR
jgi:hypothetical protein